MLYEVITLLVGVAHRHHVFTDPRDRLHEPRSASADPAQRVHGVVVRIDDRQRFARARRGVILCAGGFALNQEMLRQYAPQVARLAADGLSAGHDDGSGILMGQSVGAAAIHMDELFATLPIYPPEAHVKGILVNEQRNNFV